MPPPTSPPGSLDHLRREVAATVLARGYLRLEEPVRLRSGQWSRDYVDSKRALAQGADLRRAAEALILLADEEGWEFDAVGGPTLGADQFAHAVAVVGDRCWFVVRKREKDRGTRRRVEGAALGPGVRVLLVDDVVTMGGSIVEALEAVQETGAEVAAATALVDRGPATSLVFAERAVPYRPLLTYADLGIEPVGEGVGHMA